MSTIVVGVADTETASAAVHEAADLARALGADLHLVSAVSAHTVRKVKGAGESWSFSDADLARDHMATLKVAVGEGIEVTSTAIDDDPAKALCSEAERLDASMIVVGSVRTQGIGRVLGSVEGDVLRNAPCAVQVAKTI